MNIFTLFLISYLFQLSQTIPILNELYTVVLVLGILAAFWLVIVMFFAIGIAFAAVLWLPHIFKAVYNLGIYHPLIEESDNADGSCHFGEFFSEKIWAVFKANFVVGISLIFVLIYIFNSFPTTFFGNPDVVSQTDNKTSSVEKMDPYNVKMSNGAFSLTMMFIPAFLLSLRIFANPTQDWINFIIRTNNRSSIEINYKIKYFKDQVVSFYFSFILGTIILFLLSILLVYYIKGDRDLFSLVSPLMPKMDIISVSFFLFVELIIILVITILGEFYLKISPPIYQD